jgi:hypothetical protein
MIRAQNVIAANDAALGAHDVDRGADRGLESDAEQPATRHDQVDVGLGPVPAGDGEDVDERAEQVSRVGNRKYSASSADATDSIA